MLSAQQIDPHRHPHLLISSASSVGLHVSSPSHPASYERGTLPASSTAGADHMDHNSDFTCPLRFGDITITPKSSTAHGFAHSSLLLAGSSCSSGGSSKLSAAPAGSPPSAAANNIDAHPPPSSMSSMPAEPRSLTAGKEEDDCRQDLMLEEAAMKANPVPIPITVSASSPRSGFPGSFCGSAGSMVGSPVLPDAFLALQKFLPSNSIDCEEVEIWPALDAYSCDEFRMYEFKVRKCVRGRSHDWTECPFAHPGEKARRRDPRRYHYSGTACPDFRKGSCRKGEACEYAHGVFECWLHPARYRTQPCKDGRNCQRRVCFFAHTPEQLRVASSTAGNTGDSSPASGSSARSNLLKAAAMSGGSYDGSPLRRALAASLDASMALELLIEENSSTMGAGHHHNHGHHSLCQAYAVSSPTSTLAGHSVCPSPLTPDPSPCSSPPLSPNSQANTTTLWSSVPPHRRHLDRLRSVPTITVPSYEEAPCIAMSPPAATDSQSPRTMAELLSALQHLQIKSFNSREAAAIGQLGAQGPLWATGPAPQHPQIRSAPVTPKSRYASQQVMGAQQAAAEPLSAPLESRVESGRDLRAKIYAKLSQEMNAPAVSAAAENETPDFGWVNELVQ